MIDSTKERLLRMRDEGFARMIQRGGSPMIAAVIAALVGRLTDAALRKLA